MTVRATLQSGHQLFLCLNQSAYVFASLKQQPHTFVNHLADCRNLAIVAIESLLSCHY